MWQARDETLAQLLWLQYAGLAAPETCHRGERSPGPAIRRPSFGVVATTALVERPKGALCEAKISGCHQLTCPRLGQSHGMTYPFDCGDHAVNIPGKGLVDVRVHAVSSHDTQPAWMSNDESESGLALAALANDETTANSAVDFMLGNQDVPSACEEMSQKQAHGVVSSAY